jgi:hypothetical protein
VRGVAAGEHLAVQQQPVAGLPAGDFGRRQRVEVHAADSGDGFQSTFGQPRSGGSSFAGPRAVQREVRMARGGAVRDHRDGFDAAWVG